MILEDIQQNTIKEGRAWSRLTALTPKWSKLIKGSADFLGFNYYTSRYVESDVESNTEVPSWENDANLKYSVHENWRQAKSNWLYCVPQGLQGVLEYIYYKYRHTNNL